MTSRPSDPPGASPEAPGPPGFEPWAWVAFGLTALTLLLFVYLGSRPGGQGPVLAYRYGPAWLGLAAGGMLFLAVVWCFVRRPVLQRGRVAPLLALGLSVFLTSFPLAYPSSHQGRPSSVPFRLPVSGEWTVKWGGDERERNALVLTPDRRFGFDLLRMDELGNWMDGERDLCFGSVVEAPAPGRVVAAHDGDPDGEAPVRAENHPFGNHLVIEVAPEEFLVLGSLQEGSIAVRAGDEVETGRPLARVGNSARRRMTAPAHLMIHLQDTPEPGMGEGVPMRFHGYYVDGHRVDAGVPLGGRFPYDRHPGQRIIRVED